MTREIHAWASDQAKGALEPFNYQSPKLGPYDVLVAISHCGICHSDLHLLNNEWGATAYPFVPGHEIVGTIAEKGEFVTQEVGTPVGIGWQCGSCQHCEWCHIGEENLCESQQPTCVGRNGGFADAIVVDSRFAIPLPKGVDPAIAAPLLCGGATTFSPLMEYGVGPFSRVGVIGVGGLGHIALQFAKALGAEVIAFSSTRDKKAEALKFGADRFLSGPDIKSSPRLDLILNTAPADQDYGLYLALLKPRGVLCQLGAPGEAIKVAAHSLIRGRKTLSGSNIGNTSQIAQMLAFADKYKVKPQIEPFSIKEVNVAIQKLAAGKMRYRAVLFM